MQFYMWHAEAEKVTHFWDAKKDDTTGVWRYIDFFRHENGQRSYFRRAMNEKIYIKYMLYNSGLIREYSSPPHDVHLSFEWPMGQASSVQNSKFIQFTENQKCSWMVRK